MSRRPGWHYTLLDSRKEAITAIELHNGPRSARPLAGFLVHMHIAWTYLLHARFKRDGIDHHYRDPIFGRYMKVGNERKAWDLSRSIQERWPDRNDPVRANLELLSDLRNRVEHRHESGLTVEAFGFTQAAIINYEEELVSTFGSKYSIAADVHTPISLSPISSAGVAAMARAQADLPAKLRELFIDYRAGLDPEIADHRAFEFRIEMIQKRAPKSKADLAVTYRRIEDLNDEERIALEALGRTGQVVVHEKLRDVANVGWMKPTVASKLIQNKLGWRFTPCCEFPRAWKALKVRPLATVEDAARTNTDGRYCRYDEPHGDYLYCNAFVELVIGRCKSETGFKDLIGFLPKPAPDNS